MPNISLVSTSGNLVAGQPVTFGHVFKKGDVPSGHLATATFGGSPQTLQNNVMTRYSDSSVCHAILTMAVPSGASGSSASVALSHGAGTQTDPTPATVASALLASGYAVSVEITISGTTYTASAASALSSAISSGLEVWLNGPLMTEFRVYANLTADILATFDIRRYSNGLVRTDVIVSNDWCKVFGTGLTQPGAVTYTAVVKYGATTLVTLSNITHHKNSRWKYRVWTGTAPTVRVTRDLAYFISSRAVPPYDTSLAITEATLASRYSDFQSANSGPLGSGTIRQYMPTTGMRDDIGILPCWSVMYLLTQDARMETAMLGNADCAGSVPWHLRHETTRLTVTLDQYPGITLLWTNGQSPHAFVGGAFNAAVAGWEPDTAHVPSLCYLPYILTGDHYYLDELHAEASYCLMQANPSYRGGADGIIEEYQVRGQAWALRTLGYAAYATPASHSLKSFFTSKLQNNLSYYTTSYVTNDRMSAAGETKGYIENTNAREPGSLQAWADDYFTIVLCQLYRLGFDTGSLLQFKINFTAGRFLSITFRNAGTLYYHIYRNVSTNALYNTWQAILNATLAYSGEPNPTGLTDNYAGGYADVARGAVAFLQGVTADARCTSAMTFIIAQTSATVDPGRPAFPNFALTAYTDTDTEVPDEVVYPYGNVCPFVEWNYVFFEDNLVRMTHRGARNLVARPLNSPFVKSNSPTLTSRGVVGIEHVIRCECRVSGNASGRARMFVRGHNKLNGLAEAVSAVVNGVAGTGNWTPLTVNFTHVPHNNPKLPDALTSLVLLDHNGFGTAEFRNVTISITPL